MLFFIDDLSLKFEAAAPPVGDRGIGRGGVRPDRRPRGQVDRRRRVQPAEAAVGEPRLRRPDGLANCEIEMVRGDPHVPPGHPDLQQPWVGVDEGRASEPLHHRRGKGMPRIEQQVSFRGCIEVHGIGDHVRRQGIVGQRAQRDGVCETERLQPFLEGGNQLPGIVLGIAGVEGFQPDHPTAQRQERQGPLEVHPQVAAAMRIHDGSRRCQTDRRTHESPGSGGRSASSHRSYSISSLYPHPARLFSTAMASKRMQCA